jgi:putative ABC transport system permease protein
LLVAVLAVSIGLTLIMITVNEAFGDRLDQIKAEVGSSITVNPAGSFGGLLGGGSTLPADDVEELSSLEHVVSLEQTLSFPYRGDALESGIVRGELGGGFSGGNGPQGDQPDPGDRSVPDGDLPGPGGAFGGDGFTPPVFISGIDNPNSLSVVGAENAEVTSGRTFTEDEAEANVAVLGQGLADANDLLLGDTFELQGETIEVIGIQSSGTQFGDNVAFLPLKTIQRLFESEGQVTQVTLTVDTPENVGAVADVIGDTLGEDTADVVTEESLVEEISSPIADAQSSSQIAMIAALVASAAVILFSVGLVARQRVKEIGIFKAIGASNWQVTAQFGIEMTVISVVAGLLGALVTFPIAQSVADGLVSDPVSSAGPGGGGPFGRGPGAAAQLQGAGGFLGDVDVVVSPEVFLYALGIAIGLAVVASIVPAWYTGRVKPAEVLRYE